MVGQQLLTAVCLQSAFWSVWQLCQIILAIFKTASAFLEWVWSGQICHQFT